MIDYLYDWASLLGRWLHLITGIAWIGASFYFVWLDNHLLPPKRGELVDAGVGGELWAVHGGGFYNPQKYRTAPAELPQTLHWFYWEAYTTWLSGFFLLCLLYFGQANVYLIDPAVAALSVPVAIGIALAFLVVGWLVYDALCRSPLGRNDGALGAVLFVLLGAAAYALCHLYSGRGAYILFGATIGTMMVANVFFVIIPGQREMVNAKRDGRPLDPVYGTPRQAALGAQHLLHPARAVRDDQQPLRADLRREVQLARADRDGLRRCGDPRVVRRAAQVSRARWQDTAAAARAGARSARRRDRRARAAAGWRRQCLRHSACATVRGGAGHRQPALRAVSRLETDVRRIYGCAEGRAARQSQTRFSLRPRRCRRSCARRSCRSAISRR